MKIIIFGESTALIQLHCSLQPLAALFLSFWGLVPESGVFNVCIFTVFCAYALRPDSLMLGFRSIVLMIVPGHPRFFEKTQNYKKALKNIDLWDILLSL